MTNEILIDKNEFILEKEYARLISAFEEKSVKVLLYADSQSASDAVLSRFLKERSGCFSNIIYSEYDRNKYLYNGDMRHLGLDTVLKKSLSRSFIEKEFTFDSRHGNYFSEFESSLGKDTLLIIDNYDIASPTPYLRHLLLHECSLLIIGRKPMTSLPRNVKVIKAKTKPSAEINSLAQRTDLLNTRQKELLMTLCGMLYHLDGTTAIESSPSGVFDRESVKFYLGDLCDELDVLSEYKLISICENGRITVPQDITDYVMSVLCPTSQNCKRFIKFTNSICNFSVMQNYKDTYAKLSALEGTYNRFVSSEEFRDVYTYFCKSDKDSGKKIYNILITVMLDRQGMHKGTLNCRHLLWNNRCYFLSLAAEYLKENCKSHKIYDDKLYFDEPLSDIYSHSVKAGLDIIRLCVTLLRNTTLDLYKESEYIFKLLLSAMKQIYKEISEGTFCDSEKAAVIDDVIRLCYETFGYVKVLGEDGCYFGFRDCFQSSRIFYTCEMECDSLYASSVYMGYSKDTISLYSEFQKYIGEYLNLTKNSNGKEKIELLNSYSSVKIQSYRNIYSDISLHFTRIMNGLDKYCDYYSAASMPACIDTTDFKCDIEKVLSDNRRFLSRGFDRGTKAGAEKYSKMIMDAVKSSNSPLRVILPIFDNSYPLCGSTFKALTDKGLINLICNNENIPNLTKQTLLESLIYSYSEYCEKTEKTQLCKKLICCLDKCISHNDASLQRLYHAASSTFVRHMLFELSNAGSMKNTAFTGFAMEMYEKYRICTKTSDIYAEDYIAEVLYLLFTKSNNTINKKKLYKALKVYIFEKGNLFKKGLTLLSKEFLSEDDCDKILFLLNSK